MMCIYIHVCIYVYVCISIYVVQCVCMCVYTERQRERERERERESACERRSEEEISPQSSLFSDSLLANSPTSQKSILMVLSWFFANMCRASFEFPTEGFSAEVKQGNAPPYCFSCHPIHKYPSHEIFGAMFFALFCFVFFYTFVVFPGGFTV